MPDPPERLEELVLRRKALSLFRFIITPSVGKSSVSASASVAAKTYARNI